MSMKLNVESKQTSRLQVVIHSDDFPTQDEIEEIKQLVIKKYKLDLKKFDIITVDMGNRKKLTLSLETRKTEKNEPSVIALETYLQLLGNIRIYQKVIEYSRV